MSRVVGQVCIIASIVLVLSGPALQAHPSQPAVQQNQGHTPYYDPRYTNQSLSGSQPQNIRQTPTSQANTNGNIDLPEELPKTAGALPLLALLGVSSVICAAGLKLAGRHSRV